MVRIRDAVDDIDLYEPIVEMYVSAIKLSD